MSRIGIVAVAGAVLLAVLGFVYITIPPQAEPAVLTGTVFYEEREVLPVGSIVRVELQELSSDASSTVVAVYERITNGENVPVPFTITYDEKQVQTQAQYGLFATITFQNQILFSSQAAYPVINTPQKVLGTDIRVVPVDADVVPTPSPSPTHSVSASPETALPLVGTGWLWQEAVLFGGARIEPLEEDFVLRFTATDLVSTTDCNQISGTYISTGATLSVGPLMMTEMYCEGSQERQYAELLSTVVAARTEGRALVLETRDGSTLLFSATTVDESSATDATSTDQAVTSDSAEAVLTEGGDDMEAGPVPVRE